VVEPTANAIFDFIQTGTNEIEKSKDAIIGALGNGSEKIINKLFDVTL
jgi:hypothetical protein